MQNRGRKGTERTLNAGQRALLERKIHTQSGALAKSNGRVQEGLPSLWHAAVSLAAQLDGLPEEALHWWAAHPAGHILLTANSNTYHAGELAENGRILAAVSLIPLHQIVLHPEQAATAALLPLDHLLGCHGDPNGLWLSDGGGLNLRWQRVGQQIAKLHPLGYGQSDKACQDAHLYLAEGLRLALHHRQRLNKTDPKLERLLKASLLSASFWQRFRRDSAPCFE